MHKITIIAVAATALAGCAQGPDSIAPAAMPGGMYDGLSCQQAAAEYHNVSQTLAALEGRQRGAVAGDAVGVLLIGVPVSSLTGGDKAGLIALEKGKKLGLEARLAACPRA